MREVESFRQSRQKDLIAAVEFGRTLRDKLLLLSNNSYSDFLSQLSRVELTVVIAVSQCVTYTVVQEKFSKTLQIGIIFTQSLPSSNYKSSHENADLVEYE